MIKGPRKISLFSALLIEVFIFKHPDLIFYFKKFEVLENSFSFIKIFVICIQSLFLPVLLMDYFEKKKKRKKIKKYDAKIDPSSNPRLGCLHFTFLLMLQEKRINSCLLSSAMGK